jgi:hypothetical protein
MLVGVSSALSLTERCLFFETNRSVKGEINLYLCVKWKESRDIFGFAFELRWLLKWQMMSYLLLCRDELNAVIFSDPRVGGRIICKSQFDKNYYCAKRTGMAKKLCLKYIDLLQSFSDFWVITDF